MRWYCARGGGGGIPKPAETKYKRIVCPVNKELNYKVHAGINMSQKNRIMNPTYMLFLE